MSAVADRRITGTDRAVAGRIAASGRLRLRHELRKRRVPATARPSDGAHAPRQRNEALFWRAPVISAFQSCKQNAPGQGKGRGQNALPDVRRPLREMKRETACTI